ncbi:MAG: PIG-L family deacetylase [Alphaproteobacteria bacterium]|nr:PIG-L family deacetylase [Alphaproteobacteria bacterium]
MPSAAEIIAVYEEILQQPLEPPEVMEGLVSVGSPALRDMQPCALLLTPHPDDECLTGALPLRLSCEKNWRIINVGMTLGSNRERRAERRKELSKACSVLGFECVLPVEGGFNAVTPEAREADSDGWRKKIEAIAHIIEQLRPRAVVMPHAGDAHATHAGTYLLGMDALARMPSDFGCAVVLTEYWGQMPQPNTVVGIPAVDAARLMAALACHAGEVSRNAYDRRFPAYMIDASRRGEKVAGMGHQTLKMAFAQLYEIGAWARGKYAPSALSRVYGADAPLVDLFE